MWDYDKLFAVGNVVGIMNKAENEFEVGAVDSDNLYEWQAYYGNHKLCYQIDEMNVDAEIQYIIRLDDKGNVVERLFDREKDMPKPMPELETGMFVLIFNYNYTETRLGYINAERNMIIYQSGGWDYIDGNRDDILKIYSISCNCFAGCNEHCVIWRNPKYQDYIDSKSN